MTMPIEFIPDWEMRLARQDAFWEGKILDRPPVSIIIPKSEPAYPQPHKQHATLRDRWLDSEYQAELALAKALNCDYLGDALPYTYPNLGPEVFSAFFGCELEYGEDTAWSKPNLQDWAEVDQVRLSRDNFYWKKLVEMTEVMLEKGKHRFYTGLTDFHPGGDALAAFRDPWQLNFDMLEARDQVKALLAYVTEMFLESYDFFYEKLTAAGQAICSWPGIVSTKKWWIPCNDFSCMISAPLFDEVFLEGLVEECRHLEASIYHLDGPNALRHLDSMLAIPELNALQWVFGAGSGSTPDWIYVYQRVQEAGKGLQIGFKGLTESELDSVIENLRPEGLWINITEVHTREQAEAVIARIARWK